MPAPPPTLSTRTLVRYVLTILAVLAVLYVLYLLRQPIGWLVIAAFIAITLAAPIRWVQRRTRRWVAITVVYLGVILVPFGLAAIVVPPFVNEGSKLVNNLPNYVRDVQDYANKNKRLRKLNAQYDVTRKLQDQVSSLPKQAGNAATTLSDIGVSLLNSAFALITILFLSIFLVANGRRWLDELVRWRMPEHAERWGTLFDRVGSTFAAYIGGALVQATIAGVVAFVVMEILGIPFAAPLAVITFLLDLIPLVGATIGAVLVGVVTLFSGFPTTTIIWAVFALVYQLVENNLLQPQIQRRAVQVPAFTVLFGVLCGSQLFGVLGALLAIPVIASGQIMVREYLAYRSDLRAAEPPAGGGEPDEGVAVVAAPEL